MDLKQPNLTQKPVGDRIIVKPDLISKETESGIILADNVDRKSLTGTIISIGDETEHKFQVKPGMRIRFGLYSGTEIQEEGEEPLLIMRQEDIYTIIT